MEESHIQKRIAVTAAVDVIAGNVDLLSEILLRLPARSLIRFSVVCKLWSLLINNRQFRLNHTRAFPFSSALSGIYFYNSLTNIQKSESLALPDHVTSLPPLPFLYKRINGIGDTKKVTQSCNGLLMCVLTIQNGSKLGYVFNPATLEYHLLPNPCNSHDDHHEVVYGYFLMFDPSEAPYYKAFCVKLLDDASSDLEMSVYVPGSKSWRSSCHFSPPSGMHFDSGVCWNGAIVWIGERFLVYFDAQSEEVVTKPMPPRPRGHCSQKIRYFGEWGGHLHLIQVQSLHAKRFNMLELDKETWMWSVKYRVHLAHLISKFPEMVQQTSSGTQYAFSILGVLPGVKERDSLLLLTIPGKVIAYDFYRQSIVLIHELPGEVGDTLRFKPVAAYRYTESLASVRDWTTGAT